MLDEKFPRINFDRRGGDRLARVFPVRLHCAHSGTVLAEAMDVSQTGLKMVTPKPLGEDAHFQVVLELEPGLKLSMSGRPVWQQELNRAGQTMVGLRFTSGADDETQLQRWITAQAA